MPRFSFSLLSSFLVTGVSAFAATAPQPEPALPGVATAMQKVIDAGEMAGVVVLVADKDRVLHVSASGMADASTNKAMATDALFALMSTTKLFTTVALHMLQEEGKLKLTDPLAKYIPAFAELRTPSGKPANLTIEHILTHTSGIGDQPREKYAAATNLTEFVALYFPPPPMRAEPGAEFRYAGIWDSVGRVVEIVSGKPLDEFLHERIFAPLGMRDTTFYPTEAQVARLALPHGRNRETGVYVARPWPTIPARGKYPPIPGGGAYSTARDMGRFLQLLLRRGELDGRRYLREASLASITRIRTGALRTGFSVGEFNEVLGWGAGAYVVRNAKPGGLSALLSPGSFGHPGARGIHGVVDPTRGLAFVLLQHANPADNFENAATRALVSSTLAALAPGVK